MKVAQNDETNPNTWSVRPPHTPSISNTQLSPFGPSVRKCGTPGILSRMFSPFAGITYPCVRSPLALCIALLYFVMLCLLRTYCFFPPLLLQQTLRPALMPLSTTTSPTTLLPVQQSFLASKPPLIIALSLLSYSWIRFATLLIRQLLLCCIAVIVAIIFDTFTCYPKCLIQDASLSSLTLHSYQSALLYYRAVITREVTTGIYNTYLHTIRMVTKVGLAR